MKIAHSPKDSRERDRVKDLVGGEDDKPHASADEVSDVVADPLVRIVQRVLELEVEEGAARKVVGDEEVGHPLTPLEREKVLETKRGST